MKHFIKYFFVVALFLTIFISSAYAAKDTKKNINSSEKTQNKEVVKEETNKKKEKVTLYLFRREGCSHCADEMKFLDSIIPEYKKKIKIVVYDVTKANNNELISDVANELKLNIGGVPFNVIGTEHFEGFADSVSEDFKAFLDKAYEEQQEDIIAKLISNKKYKNLEKTDLYEAMDQEGLEYTSKESKNDNVIMVVVFAVIIVGFGTLIYFSRK